MSLLSILILIIILSVFFISSISWFYRDPERYPPNKMNVILSPADGRITTIKRYKKGTLPSTIKDGKLFYFKELEDLGLTTNDYWLLAIVMSPFDVHINRAPISGQMIYFKRTPGNLTSMRQPIFELINERATTVFENEMLRLAVIQIAAPIASSINCYINYNDMVRIGQRYGAILLGSQVDLIIPIKKQIRLSITLGSKVRAGETILAEIQNSGKDINRMDSKMSLIAEGRLDVQSKGALRFLHSLYLVNLWIFSIWLRLSLCIRRKIRI